MAILNIVTNKPGNIGVVPRRIEVLSTDDRDTIIEAGYLSNSTFNQVNVIYPTDIVDMTYSYNSATGTGTYEEFTVTFSGGVITLTSAVDPDIVLLPVVSGDFSVFNGTTGQMKDAGYSPTNAAKTKVIMANGATVANHIMVSTDTAGTSGNVGAGATAINDGSIQAGTPSIGGSLISFSVTAANGAFVFKAADSVLNTTTTITHADMGQTTTFTIPDPGNINASLLTAAGSTLVSGNLIKASGTTGKVTDVGARIIANTTGTYAGGGTSNTFAATGLTSAAKGSAVIRASTNSVAITKALPGTDTLAITFSADPGANTTVDYIYSTAAI